MTPSRHALAVLHCIALLLGGTALFSKLIELSALDITAWRSLITLGVLGIYVLSRRLRVRLDNARDSFWMALTGVLFTIHWLTFFHAIQVSTVAVGMIALFTFPVLVVLLEPFFHGARPRPFDLSAAVMVVAGVYFVVPDFTFGHATLNGVLWGLTSAFVYSLRLIFQRRYLSRYRSEISLFYQVLIAAVCLLPLMGSLNPQLDGKQWLLIMLLGVLFTALPHTLMVYCLKHLPAKTVGLVGSLQVAYAAVFGALFLQEIPPWGTVVGGLIIVSAALMESLRSARSG